MVCKNCKTKFEELESSDNVGSNIENGSIIICDYCFTVLQFDDGNLKFIDMENLYIEDPTFAERIVDTIKAMTGN